MEVTGTRRSTRWSFVELWTEQRRVLVNMIGGDLSLPAVVSKMVGGEEAWQAMASFCEDVLSRKEAAVREREADLASHSNRRGSGGIRRRPPPHFQGPQGEGCGSTPYPLYRDPRKGNGAGCMSSASFISRNDRGGGGRKVPHLPVIRDGTVAT